MNTASLMTTLPVLAAGMAGIFAVLGVLIGAGPPLTRLTGRKYAPCAGPAGRAKPSSLLCVSKRLQ